MNITQKLPTTDTNARLPVFFRIPSSGEMSAKQLKYHDTNEVNEKRSCGTKNGLSDQEGMDDFFCSVFFAHCTQNGCSTATRLWRCSVNKSIEQSGNRIKEYRRECAFSTSFQQQLCACVVSIFISDAVRGTACYTSSIRISSSTQ